MMNFSVIRYRGDPKRATTLDGHNVYRADQIFCEEVGGFVPCASYSEHFIYKNPSKRPGTSKYMCTCGSMAVIAGVSAYQGMASPQGLMLVCYLHSTFGHHSNTSKQIWI